MPAESLPECCGCWPGLSAAVDRRGNRGKRSARSQLGDPLLKIDDEGCFAAPTKAGSPTGILWLRACDGFARNIVFANQMDLLRRYVGLGSRGSQQAAQIYSAISSGMPMLVGMVAEKLGIKQMRTVVIGCVLEAMGMFVLAVLTRSAEPRTSFASSLALFFCVFYAIGYGAVTSTLPVLGGAAVPSERRAAFMQCFFAALAAGSVVGILASGMAQVRDEYCVSFIAALFVFGIGATALTGCKGNLSFVSTSVEDGAHEAVTPYRVSWTAAWPLLAMWPFYAAYSQWTTSWYLQAEFSDRRVAGMLVPMDWLQVVERLSAIFFLLALRRFWTPSPDGKMRRNPPSPLLRMALASGVAALALALSAVMEIARRDHLAGELSVAWLMPQFVLIAAAEALAFPAQTDWASGSSALIGLSCASHALASASLGASLGLPWLRDWLPEGSPDEGRYELYYFVLASLCLMAAVALGIAGFRGVRAPDYN